MTKELKKFYDENQSLINADMRKAINDFEEAVRKKHKKISQQRTNPNHVKQKAGMDYVEFSYMKNKANEHFPLWSFKNLKIAHEFLVSGWVVVQGELHFFDEGVPRVGSVAAAHRIAFKSGESRTPENIVDLGNDVKAAVSDAMKKAFNVYMNISDDIYRALEIEPISKRQQEVLYSIVELCQPDTQKKFYSFIDNSVYTNNFTDTLKRLLGTAYKYQSTQSTTEEATKVIKKLKESIQSEFDIQL